MPPTDGNWIRCGSGDLCGRTEFGFRIERERESSRAEQLCALGNDPETQDRCSNGPSVHHRRTEEFAQEYETCGQMKSHLSLFNPPLLHSRTQLRSVTG
jgi:hypothetical protein